MTFNVPLVELIHLPSLTDYVIGYISAIASCENYIWIGTSHGNVYSFSRSNASVNSCFSHQGGGVVNSLSCTGNYLCSGSEDGSVVFMHEKCVSIIVHCGGSPITSLAVNPFSWLGICSVCFGDKDGRLWLFRRGTRQEWDRKWIITAGGGQISCIFWNEELLAWGDDRSIKIIDISSQQKLGFFQKPPGECLNKPNCFWLNGENHNKTLIIGWSTLIQIISIQPEENSQARYANIVKHFVIPGVSFVGIFSLSWDIMAALTDDNELHCIQISSNKIVHSQTLIGWSSDKRWIYSEEDPLGSSFVVSATEIVLIRKSDVFDAAHWLANKNRLNQARAFASKGGSETEKHVLNSCLKRLFKEKKMQLAANVIRHLKLEREEWKVCILAFDREKTLPELTNCLDIEQTDVGDLLVRLIERYPTVAKEAIKKWKNYTNVSVLIDVVFAQMSICEKPILWTIAGVVLEVTDKIEEAFKCYIKSQSMEVFDFINRYMNHLESHNKISDSLICQIIDHLTDLIEIDYEESMSIILNPLLEKSAHQIVRMLCNKNNFNRHIDQFLLTFVSKMSSKSPLILESFKLEYPLLYRFAVMAERRPPPYSEFSPFDELLSNDNKSTSLVKILLNDICDCSSALKLAAKHIGLSFLFT
eukprot:GHVL01023253.1.p1 GENE.GHVL01023253.1~~GHVL01023253.1.p1  ORF type:complete len:645 (+),score=84.42 GHVL01023253.1:109-2043(+)